MKIRKTHLMLSLSLFFGICSFICLIKTENTSAYSIGRATVDALCIPLSQLSPTGKRGYGECDPDDEDTWFDISIYNYDFDDWEWVEHCHCVEPKKDLTWSIKSASLSLVSGNLYRVTFQPTSSSAQKIQCTMRIYSYEPEEYTLTAHAVDMSGNIIEYDMDWDTVEEGDYAEVRYYSQGSDYEFVGWKTCKRASCSIVETGRYYGDYLYDDETVYAAFSEKVVTEEPCSDGTETKKRTENGTINISGSTTVSIASSDATKGSDGIYQAKINGDVTVAFDHTVKRDNDGNTYNITEKYGLNNYSGYSSSINSGGSITKANNQTVSVPLTIDDTNKTVCEYVGFQPSTWSFTKTYTDKYSVDGICTYVNGDFESFTRTGESLISRGTTPSYSAPTSNGNNGQSSNTCVSIHRPWNFKITGITPNNSNGEKIVYAGSTISANDLKFNIAVAKNNNSYLITDIPNVNFTVVATLKDKNGKVLQNLGAQELDGTFRISPDGVKSDVAYLYYANRDNYNATYMINSESVNVPDTKAGNRLCFQLTANRNNSGNGYASNFNGSTTSSEVCYTIAKHPTFQVWGGNFYTAGKVDAYDFAATKNNVDGDNSRPYSFASANDNDNDNDNAISFNPWVELAVVAGNGNAKGLSSGAATAYTWNNGFTQSGNSFCDNHSPLSIAGNCNDDTLGASGATVGGNIKTTLYNRYIADKANVENTTTINGATFNATKIIYSKDNTVTINGNIQASNQAYTSLSEIPVYIIYAKNIDIACSVGQIDAILIADGGAIDTCYGDDDKNSSARSNQLTINGLVIADKLILGRTYGAAYGQNSNIPAEIFNLSPMFYLWSGNETMGEGAKNYIVYTRELAPRY